MWWKLLAGAVSLALAGFLVVMYGNARAQEGRMAERSERLALDLKDAQTIADQRVAGEQRVTAAVTSWGERAAALKPIIAESHDKETIYAQSPAGHVLCRDVERVRSIDALDAAFAGTAPASSAAGSAGAVPAGTAAPPAGR